MTFFAPKDFKKGRLISNKFRKIDILIMGVATLISIPSFLICMTQKEINIINISLAILSVIPVMLAFFLIQPYQIYHNFLVYFILVFKYLKRQKKFKWGGIYKYEEKEEY